MITEKVSASMIQQLSHGLHQKGPFRKAQVHPSGTVFSDFQFIKYYQVNLFPCREELRLYSFTHHDELTQRHRMSLIANEICH